MKEKLKNALVIGGGSAGLSAALTLARGGVAVDLVEKSGFAGGYGIQYGCKASPDCVMCGACSVEKLLKEAGEEPNIRMRLSSEVAKVEGAGPFSVTVAARKARILPEKCNGCGKCYERYGAAGLILRGPSHNNRPFYALAGNGEGVDPAVCPEAAIAAGASESIEKIAADAVVVATGFAPFDAAIKSTYGIGKFRNVTTGLEVERTRRQKGEVLRPSDGAVPSSIAFIQCVGSRDERLGNPWCSQVCCAYALRIGKSLKFRNPDTQVTVFYMDIQSVGKGFSAFYEECRKDFRFIRNIPVDVFPEENDRVRLMWAGEDGQRVEEAFDMLVLSVGITPNPGTVELAKITGLALNADGFLTAASERPGLFVAGTAGGPGNIAASIAEGGRAALEALKLMKEKK